MRGPMQRPMHSLRQRLGPGAAAAGAVLLALCALQALALLRSPPAWLPAHIEVRLAPGAAIELDGAALAVPAPDVRLRLRRDAEGRWWAGGAGAGPVRLERGGRSLPSASLVLQPGVRFQLGALHYAVDAAGPQSLRFNDGRHRWRYDGATVWRDGAPLSACPGDGPGARLAGAWNRWLPLAVAIERPLVFGGNLSCSTRIGNAHAAPGSALLRFVDGAPVLGAAAALRTPLLVERGGLPFELALAEQPLAGVSALGIGRTRIAIDAHAHANSGGAVLRLRPLSRVALAQQPRATLPDGVRWHWEQREAWRWPFAAWPSAVALAGALCLALCLALYLIPLRRRPGGRAPARAAQAAAGLALAGAGLALLLAQRAGLAPGAAWSLLLCWAALWYGLAWRAGPVLQAGVLLLAAGLLLQLELGLGAPDSAWLRHFQKTAAATALGMGCAGAWSALRRAARPAPIVQSRVEALLLLLAASAMAALLVQVGWGNETGVFDLQPVEFAKLALTVLAAHCIALGLGGGPRQAGALLRWLRLGAPALLFAVLLGVALVQVDDYSPLILLLVWGAAMLLAWSFAARRAGPALALAALGACCLAGLALLRGAGIEATSEWSFYGERFGVWLDPAAHPHTGQQLLLGAAAIAGGGWFGADGMFGLASLGQGALEALAIPAVQDDFAPSFLLQRHGLWAGLALWTLQALFLWALLQAALRAWQDGQRAGDFRQAWSGRFRCFVLCGGAAFLFGHFLLSWGTNLAFFPIMGQPMSFLSAGGSHLLFFIFPLLAFAAAGANTIEEN